MGHGYTVRLTHLLAAAAFFYRARASVWRCLSDRAATLKLGVVVLRGVLRLPEAVPSSRANAESTLLVSSGRDASKNSVVERETPVSPVLVRDGSASGGSFAPLMSWITVGTIRVGQTRPKTPNLICSSCDCLYDVDWDRSGGILRRNTVRGPCTTSSTVVAVLLLLLYD